MCPLCMRSGVAHPSIRADAWHFLSCVRLMNGEISTRHDGVAEQVSRCAMLLGMRARREVKGLPSNTSLRPDLLLSLPGRTVLSDVAVCHPLAPGTRRNHRATALGTARHTEAMKRKKYLALSSQHCFEQLPIVLETMGGIGPAAVTLIKAIADASQEHLAMWTRVDVVREVAGSLAMAVQRGNAMAFLEGYERVQAAALAEAEHAHRKAKDTKEDEGEEKADESMHTTEEEDDSGEEESSEDEDE